MLSLDKTKDVAALAEFAGSHEVLMSWKLDGLTVVLTYRNGALEKAVTRGKLERLEKSLRTTRAYSTIPLHILSG